MSTVAFILTMPVVSSWNGKWSGEGRLYCITRHLRATQSDFMRGKESAHFSHYFGDGWCASVEARIVDGKQAAKLRKKSAGFCGYDWMVDAACPAQAAAG